MTSKAFSLEFNYECSRLQMSLLFPFPFLSFTPFPFTIFPITNYVPHVMNSNISGVTGGGKYFSIPNTHLVFYTTKLLSFVAEREATEMVNGVYAPGFIVLCSDILIVQLLGFNLQGEWLTMIRDWLRRAASPLIKKKKENSPSFLFFFLPWPSLVEALIRRDCSLARLK